MQLSRRIPIGIRGHYMVQELLVDQNQALQYLQTGRRHKKQRRLSP